MKVLLDAVLVFVILLNMAMLGSSRIAALIRLVAVHGMVLALLTILLHIDDLTLRVVLLAVGGVVVKGIVLPILLGRALRESRARREVEPFVGYTVSILVGVLLIAASFWLRSRLPLETVQVPRLVVSVALFTSMVGLFLIVSRRTALTQVIGYLVLENGIYAFGVALAHDEPLLVEMGVLLDVFVAVFVMGIAIFHISREFDSIDVDQLSSLKDSER